MTYDVMRLRETEFPITQQYAYFNNCGTTPLPLRSARAAQDFLDRYVHQGMLGVQLWMPCVERTRAKLARLLNVTAPEIALVKNTAEGLGIVAQAIPWQPGDVILVAQGEFPANIYCWKALEHLGVEVRLLHAADERITPELFAPALRQGSVRLVAISWVQFHTGYRTDLAALSALCQEFGALLCVDAIQAAGALPLDLSAVPVDFCAFGGNKWLLSLQGTGCLYVNQRVRNQLIPANVGWLGVPWTDYEVLDPSLPLSPDAAQYEEGTRPNICIAALEQSLDLIDELGLEAIATQIKAVTDHLVAGLRAWGGQIRSQRAAEEWSGIVAWTHPQHQPQMIVSTLEAANVMVSVREGSVRAAPHCYNTHQEVDRLLAALPR